MVNWNGLQPDADGSMATWNGLHQDVGGSTATWNAFYAETRTWNASCGSEGEIWNAWPYDGPKATWNATCDVWNLIAYLSVPLEPIDHRGDHVHEQMDVPLN